MSQVRLVQIGTTNIQLGSIGSTLGATPAIAGNPIQLGKFNNTSGTFYRDPANPSAGGAGQQIQMGNTTTGLAGRTLGYIVGTGVPSTQIISSSGYFSIWNNAVVQGAFQIQTPSTGVQAKPVASQVNNHQRQVGTISDAQVNHQRQVGTISDAQVNHQRQQGTIGDGNVQNNHQRQQGTIGDGNVQNNHQRQAGTIADAVISRFQYRRIDYNYPNTDNTLDYYTPGLTTTNYVGYFVAPYNIDQRGIQIPTILTHFNVFQQQNHQRLLQNINNDTVNHQRAAQTINNDTKNHQRAAQTTNNDQINHQRAAQTTNNDQINHQRAAQTINNDTKTPQVAIPASGTLYNGYWVETQPGAQGQPGSVTGSTILLNIGQMGVLTTQGGSIQSTGPATGQYQTSATTFLQNQVAGTTTAVVQTQQGVVIWGGTPATAHN